MGSSIHTRLGLDGHSSKENKQYESWKQCILHIESSVNMRGSTYSSMYES